MPLLDVFNGDAFTLQSLTDGIEKMPYKPGMIGALQLFRDMGITTKVALVEEKDGQLTLIPNTPRGAPASTLGESKRTARSFVVPHLEREAKIYADEVQSVRAFGEETETETVQGLVDQRLMELRSMHEVTLEFHRFGALQGVVLDADGSSTIFDYFTEFGVTQQTKDIALGTASTNVRSEVIAAKRLSEDELGGQMVSNYIGLASDQWFDAFIEHDKVRDTFNFQEQAILREDIRTSGFRFGGVTWYNYRGTVAGEGGDVDFIADDIAYLAPVADIYRTYYAPADFIETVNTMGRPLYAKIVIDQELQRWAKVHSQSNPLAMCTRPRAVIKLTKS